MGGNAVIADNYSAVAKRRQISARGDPAARRENPWCIPLYAVHPEGMIEA